MTRAERRRLGLVPSPAPAIDAVIELSAAAEAVAAEHGAVEVYEPVEPATVVMSLAEVTAAMAARSEPAPASRRAARTSPPTASTPAAEIDDEPERVLEVVDAGATATGAEPSGAHGAADRDSDDPFEVAARLFNFTGEVSIARPVDAEDVAAPVHLAVRRRGHHALKRIAAAGSSLVVMGLAGVLAVGLTTSPTSIAASASTEMTGQEAVADVKAGEAALDEDDIQAFVAPSDVQNRDVVRDEKYSSVTVAEIASDAGIRNFSSIFTNDPNAAIQWPFDVGVPMSYGYGMRSGRLHEGIDFTPGEGAPIQAIADGVVRIATESGGAFGVTVVIDHVLDGEIVSSRYAHMQYGSLEVVAGQEVKVGDTLGLVGSTGRSYGAHLHFELHDASGNSFDPWPWMVEHAGGARR